MKFKKIVALALFLVGSFAFCETNKKEEEKQELGFVENIKSFKSHRFLEFRGAFPYPVLTTHGSVQSLVVGFGDTFGETFSFGTDFDNTSPSIATDLNLTVFPPFSDYSLGFMSGVSLDKWNHKKKDNSDETLWMNYYYVGFHADYAHWVLLDIGTRLSVYGELSIGLLRYSNDDESKNAFGFDVCPFGIQFCIEKHVGFYFEFPHIGARPFLQTGISIGL